jgi:CBS domain containing-hemolysin-like protein
MVLAPTPARASMLSGAALATAADVIAWVVLVMVPVIGIALFWLVHVMPEKIAHRRHHPQKEAIKTLCLLSLVFGGLLWPIAWLWAYTRPAGYRLAYGTEKHDEWFVEMGERAARGELEPAELQLLREELDSVARQGALSAAMRALRDRLDAGRTGVRRAAAVEASVSPAGPSAGSA